MTIILSPSKTLDFESMVGCDEFSIPHFIEHSKQLIETVKKMNPHEIEKLMGISSKLAELNFERYLKWTIPFTKNNSKQAFFAFKGDVYEGLDVESLSIEDLKFAQKNVRILSGLYGSLKPLDLIQPYRLEMGVPLNNSKGKNLYEFWGSEITSHLNETFVNNNTTLINLASVEYSKSIQFKNINAKIITPVFKDFKDGSYKIISFYAKKARGLMTRFIIQNKISNPVDILAFNLGGYSYNSELSKDLEPIFTR